MNALLMLLVMMAGGDKKVEGFPKDWEPVLHSSKFKGKPELDAQVRLEKDRIVLRNRGMIVSKKEFPKDKGKIVVSFTCKWNKGDGAYQDDLAIILRTSAEQRQQWSHEVLNGLLVRLNLTAGEVQVVQVQGKNHELVGQSGHMFKNNVEYKVRIIDDGQRLQIFIDDGKEPVFDKNAPPHDTDGKKIALYDREPVGGVEHEVIITGLKVEVKK